MAMHPDSTYCYATTVPEGAADSAPWVMERAQSFDGVPCTESDISGLGDRPFLHVIEAGIISNPSASRPSVVRCGLQLARPDDKFRANTQFIDKALIHACRPGDRFHVAYTGVGGTDISLLRNGKLIFAVGEISALPLGEDFTARTPIDLALAAERIFHARDPEFRFLEIPLEISYRGKTRLLCKNSYRLDGYHVGVMHGFKMGEPGTPECATISFEDRAITS